MGVGGEADCRHSRRCQRQCPRCEEADSDGRGSLGFGGQACGVAGAFESLGSLHVPDAIAMVASAISATLPLTPRVWIFQHGLLIFICHWHRKMPFSVVVSQVPCCYTKSSSIGCIFQPSILDTLPVYLV